MNIKKNDKHIKQRCMGVLHRNKRRHFTMPNQDVGSANFNKVNYCVWHIQCGHCDTLKILQNLNEGNALMFNVSFNVHTLL